MGTIDFLISIVFLTLEMPRSIISVQWLFWSLWSYHAIILRHWRQGEAVWLERLRSTIKSSRTAAIGTTRWDSFVRNNSSLQTWCTVFKQPSYVHTHPCCFRVHSFHLFLFLPQNLLSNIYDHCAARVLTSRGTNCLSQVSNGVCLPKY